MSAADDEFFPKHPIRRAFGHPITFIQSTLTRVRQSKERTKPDMTGQSAVFDASA